MTLQVNRNMISVLSYSAKSGRAIDFERALKFPLSAAPLCIANGDGIRRETTKSKLMDLINIKGNENSTQAPIENTKTFKNHFQKIIKMLPFRCTTLYIVVDSYREVSIKSAERKKRGVTQKSM